jgi:hypothetical protein
MATKKTITTLPEKILSFLRRPARWFEWLIIGVLVIFLAVTLTGQLTGGKTEIKISILGQSMSITTSGGTLNVPVNVVVRDGISYVKTSSGEVPLRAWLELQGFLVSWDQDSQSVIAEK